jgi:membrane protein YdbS with pleckstrin-like domain
MEELFAPPADDWQRLSPKFRTMRRLVLLVVVGVIFSAAAVVVGLASGLWWLSAIIWAVALVIIVIRWIVLGRNWRSWGYLERDDDLFITHGVLFRSLVTVPYGRLQLVEVSSTPLQRWFGLATVELITASASTDAVIPGLLPAEAKRLRDELSQLGESRFSGL